MTAILLFHIPKEVKQLLYGVAVIIAFYAGYYALRAIRRFYRDRLLLSVAEKNGLIHEKISHAPFQRLSSVETGTVRRILSSYWCRKNGVLFGIADISAYKWQRRTGELGSRGRRDYYSRTVIFIPLKNALPHMGTGSDIRGQDLKRDVKQDRPLGYITCEKEAFQKIKLVRELKELLNEILTLMRISYYPYSLAFEVKDLYLVICSEKGRIPAKRMNDVIERSLEVKAILEKLSERLSAF